jgi:pimeloyl-ACP methyl ester carboxylesterase
MDGARAHAVRAMLLLVLTVLAVGCAQQKWVRLREVPDNPLAGPLQLLSHSGPKPTLRTMLLVRRYDLEDELNRHSSSLLTKLWEINRQEPSADKLYALAELSYLAAKRSEPINRQRALELHGIAMVNAYKYLFDERFGRFRNPYDPEFRGSCDLYNSALENALRIINRRGGIEPGSKHTIRTANQTIEAEIVLRGQGWHNDEFKSFHFVSDYEVQGLQNHYHSYGLGVPMIAVRKQQQHDGAQEKYYPPGMSFPVTAFLRVLPNTTGDGTHHVAHLELHDPLNTSEISVDGRRIPLESDLTTPLAYALNQKELQDLESSTVGLLNVAKTEKLQGLYMLEPYQPGKIPVIMVHGVWSSPITWMAMFNDLRGAPEIRSRYQFWFYLYPSGQPFWYSAADLRKNLAETRELLDPGHRQPALDQMVLVGHSMGGLLARLQTINSADQFWRTVSDQPFQEIKASDEVRQELAGAFFFGPSPSVRRVITIGTPYRGSEFVNSTTRWLSSKIIKLPKMFISSRQQLHADNPGAFKDPSIIDVDTSIDSLAPDSPVLPVMLKSQPAPWVHCHTIIGVIPDNGLLGKVVGEGDGVVSYASAHLDHVDSEIVVNADHTTVHSHPLTVLEVHRILLAHLAEVDRRQRPDMWPRAPMTAQAPGSNWSPNRPANGAPYPTTHPMTNAASAAPWPNVAPEPAQAQLWPRGAAPGRAISYSPPGQPTSGPSESVPPYATTQSPWPDRAQDAWPPSSAAAAPAATPRTPLYGAPVPAY